MIARPRRGALEGPRFPRLPRRPRPHRLELWALAPRSGGRVGSRRYGRGISPIVLNLIAFLLLAVFIVPAGRVKARLGHPMLLAVKVWALAHLLANGTLADILLFGSFLDLGGGGFRRQPAARPRTPAIVRYPRPGAERPHRAWPSASSSGRRSSRAAAPVADRRQPDRGEAVFMSAQVRCPPRRITATAVDIAARKRRGEDRLPHRLPRPHRRHRRQILRLHPGGRLPSAWSCTASRPQCR